MTPTPPHIYIPYTNLIFSTMYFLTFYLYKLYLCYRHFVHFLPKVVSVPNHYTFLVYFQFSIDPTANEDDI